MAGILVMTKLTRWAHRLEISLVSFFMASARNPAGFGLARLISRLGNLWIYPPIALALVILAPVRGLLVIVTALCNVGLLQVIYKPLKHRVSRRRPFQIHAKFQSTVPTLDEHSFPSGHIMTLTGVLIPIVMAFPFLLKICLVLWCTMAWARIATAHHFVSDIIGGAIMGVCIAYPISAFMLYEIRLLNL